MKMTAREKLLKQFISWPLRELAEDWFYVNGTSFPTWLHVCKPHFWKLLEEMREDEGRDESHLDKLAFSAISLMMCRKCLKPVPTGLRQLGRLLSLGREIA